jgi:hypothetical protein
LKVAVTVTLFIKLSTVHIVPLVASHPAHPPNVPVVDVAVNVTVVPVGKLATQAVALEAQPSPEGELEIVPAPVPAKSTVMVGPVPVKHVRFAVMYPVTTAPDEETPEPSLLVCTVADTRVPPHTRPVAVKRPVESTVNICGVFEVQVT